MSVKLKSCPYCGGKPVIKYFRNMPYTESDCQKSCFIYKAVATIIKTTRRDYSKAWNRRAE